MVQKGLRTFGVFQLFDQYPSLYPFFALGLWPRPGFLLRNVQAVAFKIASASISFSLVLCASQSAPVPIVW